MDFSHKDFTALLSKLDTVYGLLEWQMPSDIPTLNRVFEEVKAMRKIALSYVDDDPESTTAEQLEMMFPEVEDENGYGNW